MKTESDGLFSNLDHVSLSIGKSNPLILSKEFGSVGRVLAAGERRLQFKPSEAA